MTDALTALLTRRSTSVRDLRAPAPGNADLKQILTIATRVPDHGKLTPWRIKILREEGARKLGAIAAEQFAAQNADVTEAHLAAERTRFTRAPLCLAVLSTPILGTKPVWEQELSAGAVCMNILHAAHVLGYGAKWLTEWVAFNDKILTALGGNPEDKIAGFVYLGTKYLETADRERPKLDDIAKEY
ncbi:MAG: nitroreductase family protein [Rickettsiales bacterium]